MKPAQRTVPPARSAARTAIYAGLAALLAVLLFGVFFRFNPTEYRFFPRCVFHAVSGWDCPGCGGQRALHHLLHGQFDAALRANALFIFMLPVAGWFLGCRLGQQLTGRKPPTLFAHHRWPWLLCGLVITFGIVRNLPGFDWLRP